MTVQSSSPFSLCGRVAVVTGGSRGLGASAADSLADAGAHVVLVARDRRSLDERVHALAARGAQVSCATGDVSTPGAAESIVRTAISQAGRVDILVNAAGAITRGSADVTTDDEFERVM